MSAAPRSVLYIRPDSIGDLVIFTSALSQLLAAWPETKHTLVVRPGYETLAPLFSPALRWQVASINPFVQRPSETRESLATLFTDLEKLAPDVIVAPTFNRTWLEVAIAAHFPTARRIALGRRSVEPYFRQALRLEMGVEAETMFTEFVPADEQKFEWDNNHRVVDHLLERPTPRTWPTLTVPPELNRRAEATLAEMHVPAGEYIAVFVGGMAHVPIKAWPAARFAELILWLQREKSVPLVLMAEQSEAGQVEEIVSALLERGGRHPPVWLGQPGKFALLTALLSRARCYVGHDTGAMHAAAAVDRPVVGIFGGGHWPRFRPVGRRVVSVVQPLPCFGCQWNCHFGDAPCVKTIVLDDVCRAVAGVLDEEASTYDRVVEARSIPADMVRLIQAVTPRYLALQRDQIGRLHMIEDLQRELGLKAMEIAALEREKAFKESQLLNLTQVVAANEVEIGRLKRAVEQPPSDLGLLRAAAAGLQQELAAVQASFDTERSAWSLERLQLKAAADHETRALLDLLKTNKETIEKLTLQLQLFQKLFAERNALIERHEAHTREYNGLASGRLALEAVTPENHNGSSVHNGTAHDSLTLPANGLWPALLTRFSHNSVGAWLFRQVVENYWMRLGAWRHYEPRSIAWDKMPKPKLLRESLPQAAVVTPSFEQQAFVESAMLSVLNQQYPKLLYLVQDGGSRDASPDIIARYADRLLHWESAPDMGPGDAIMKGFRRVEAMLAPDDIMAWLDSDDLMAPRALRTVAEYFVRHPRIDVVYGHRILIDTDDREIGRWVLPPHTPKALEWVDCVPHETIFWRKRAWERVGGIDPSFRFALGWDLLARFSRVGCKIVRVPYFLGCHRVHPRPNTAALLPAIHAEEEARVRRYFHPEEADDIAKISKWTRRMQFRGALTARLHRWKIRV
jgi:ADP-heptose:LPS heptosyltransferase/GT2 family glycosyltransferase